MTVELWRDIPGYEGLYQISDIGSVRNVKRNRLLAKNITRGHFQVRLCNHDGHRWFQVHRLVLMAFIGECPADMECAHNNGIGTDNRLENLRWDTRKGNHADKHRHGTALIGERNHLSKLTGQDVLDIKTMHSAGVTGRNIAKAFGVTPANISQILLGRTWRQEREGTANG